MSGTELFEVGDTSFTPTELANRGLWRHTTGVQEAERRARMAYLRRAMFDLLKHGGYDRVEVEFDTCPSPNRYSCSSFAQGGIGVRPDAVPVELRHLVESYVEAAISRVTASACYGTARIYTASEYAAVEYAEWHLLCDGQAGPEVPDEDRLSGLDAG